MYNNESQIHRGIVDQKSQHVKDDSSLWDVRESTKREVLLKEIVINAEIFILSNNKIYTPENLMSEKPNQTNKQHLAQVKL